MIGLVVGHDCRYQGSQGRWELEVDNDLGKEGTSTEYTGRRGNGIILYLIAHKRGQRKLAKPPKYRE